MSKFTSFEFGGSKATLRMFVMFLCLAMSLPGWAQREFMDSSNGLYYQLDDEKQTAELMYKKIGGSWSVRSCYTAKEYVIPASLNVSGKNYKVVELADSCFLFCSELESVTLPSTVERIGNYAFLWASSLKKVNLDEGLREIGRYAFATANLNSLTLEILPLL